MRSGRVIILEASKRTLSSRTHILEQEGYRVTGVATVEQAVKVAGQQSYKLLIIHVDEPALLNMLLAQFPPEISILIISNKEAAGKIAECSGTGLHSFLIQPFSTGKFKNTVSQSIDRTCLVEAGFRNKVLTTLEQANRLIASEAETDRLYKLIVKMSATATGADYVSLAIKKETKGKFDICAQQGGSMPAWERLCQQVMKTDEPLLLDEATEYHPELRNLITQSGISSLLCIPLIIKGKMIGAINHIKVTKKKHFSPGDLNFASILGWWSSIVLENARLISNVQEQRLHVEKLLEEISLAQQNERKRVAIEIHDGVAQWMVGATYDIRVCSNLIAESRLTELEFELTKIRETLQRSIREIRRAIANLRPLPLEEVGLIGALRQAAEMLNEDGIRCHTRVDGKLPKLNFAEETTTYWIVQEILTNIRNHSEATYVHLQIRSNEDTVSVEVSDNGQGFDTNELINNTVPLQHMGLIGMQERAKLLGGSLDIRSIPGQGTSICFAFPVSSRLAIPTKV